MIIYKITNHINGKVYIGLTTQQDHRMRWYSHVHRSKDPDKHSVIHKAINKYGKENFSFDIIDGANSFSELKYKEIHHIYQYNSLAPNGYNIDIGESKTVLVKMKSSPIVGTSDSGDIKKLRRLKDISEMGGCHKTLSAMLSGTSNYKKMCGFYWEYEEKETIKDYGKRDSTRPLRVTTPEGELIEFDMIKNASDLIGVHPGNLSTKLKRNKGKCEYHGFFIESKKREHE